MGILKKMKNAVFSEQAQPTPSGTDIFFEQMFKQSKNFRGHKRFRMTIYGYGPTEQGMRDFMAAGGDLELANILLRGRRADNNEFLDVIVNGHLIGSIPNWTVNEDEKKFLQDNLYSGKITSAHVRVDETNRIVAYLFLKAD